MKTRLKEVRKSSGISQEEAARIFGVSIGTYRNWEQGRVVMNGAQLIRASEIFGTSVDYILMMDVDVEGLDLSGLEQTIISSMRSMSDEGQEKVVSYAEDIAPRYPRGE